MNAARDQPVAGVLVTAAAPISAGVDLAQDAVGRGAVGGDAVDAGTVDASAATASPLGVVVADGEGANGVEAERR